MSYNVIFHMTVYLVAGLHVMIGLFVGGIYLRALLGKKQGKAKLHAKHVVPAAFGWAGAVFAEAWNTLREVDLALPVRWSDYLLLAGLLMLGFAVVVLFIEGAFVRTKL